MTLKGLATLQRTLGKAPSNGGYKNNKPRKSAGGGQGPRQSPAVGGKADGSLPAAGRQKSGDQGDGSVRHGQAVAASDMTALDSDEEEVEQAPGSQPRCLICHKLLPADNTLLNAHIDACLSKGSMRRGRHQTKLFQFATHQPTPSPVAATAAASAAASVAPEQPAALSSGVNAGPSQLHHAAAAIAPLSVPAATAAPAPARCASTQSGPAERDSVSWSSQSPAGSPHSLSSQPPPASQGSPRGRSSQKRKQPEPCDPSPSRPPPLAAGGPSGGGSISRITVPLCHVVGRQFQRDAPRCYAGQRVVVQWEQDNPRDKNALLVTHAATGAPLGHLPYNVARHLARPIREQGVVVEGLLLEDPPSDKAPLAVELQVTMTAPTMRSPAGKSRRDAAVAVRDAAAAAAEHAVKQPQGTGERLRANFVSMLETVLQHDSHLLDRAELGFARGFQDLDPPAAALLLRLFQRRGPWFRVGPLSYAEVPDKPGALRALCAAGLARVVHAADGSASGAPWGAMAVPVAAAGISEPGARSGTEGAAASAVEAADSAAVMAASPAGGLDSDESSAEAGWEFSEGEEGQGASGTSPMPAPGAAAAPGQGSGSAGAAAAVPSAGPSIGWQELADLLTVPELGTVLLSGSGAKRAALLEALRKRAGRDEADVRRTLLRATGDVVRLSEGCCEAIDRIQRLFFLNEGQNLSQFLAADLGGVRYPQYDIQRHCSAFASRQALLDYERALRLADILHTALEDGDEEAAMEVLQHAWAALDVGTHKQTVVGGQQLPHYLRRFNAGWVYCQMGTLGVSLLQNLRDYSAANKRLRQLLDGDCDPSRRGWWWQRLSINLGHLGYKRMALEAAEEALDEESGSLSPGDLLALRRRVLSLGTPPLRWRAPPWKEVAEWGPNERQIEAEPLGGRVGAKLRFQGQDGQLCSVEELALQYYASEEGGGWCGMHSEGGIWSMLFGLLFWEVLFMPVPGVLRTPFQTAPLDLDTEAFLPARQGAIEGLLSRICEGEAPALLAQTWQAQYGVMCRGVNWEQYPLEQLQEVTRCIGGHGLAAVCRLLAEDHGGWSGGMPDLLLWNPRRRAAKLSEVKSQNDSLSDQQRAWMKALDDSGLAVELLKVVAPAPAGRGGAKRARRR